jgi:hypothetical protein
MRISPRQTCHSFGLAAGVKNVPQMSARLADEADFAVMEQCAQYNECRHYAAYTRRVRNRMCSVYTLFCWMQENTVDPQS